MKTNESPEIDEITLHDFFFAAAISGMSSRMDISPREVVQFAKEVADKAIQTQE